MITFESKRSRVFVGRIERGERVRDALVRFAAVHGVQSAWVSGIGAFEWVDLCEYDQERQVYGDARRFESPTELLSLQGNLSTLDDTPMAHLHATISRETDNGIEVLGGHVEAACAFAIEVRIEAFDDVALVREMDDQTGLHLWRGASDEERAATREPGRAKRAPRAKPARQRSRRDEASARPAQPAEPEPEPAADSAETAADGAVTWAMAAAASELAETPEAALSDSKPKKAKKRKPATIVDAHMPSPVKRRKKPAAEPTFEPNVDDFVEHQQFGVCKVLRINDDGGMLIRLESGRQKLIKLDFMEVSEPRRRGDAWLYPIAPRRKR